MGLFSSIKKKFKKVARAIKKEFKRKMKKLGKVLNSKWGKALLIVAAVFTAGIALAAAAGAVGAQAAGATFLTKFVAGAKAFVGALMNPIGAAKNMMGGAGAAAGAGAGAAEAAAPAIGEVAGQAAGNASMDMIAGASSTAADLGTGAAAGFEGATHAAAQTAAQAAPTMAQMAAPVAPSASGGFLSAAGNAAKEFVKSPGGGQVVSSMVQGFAAGQSQEELLKAQEAERRRQDEEWRDPGKLENLRSSVRDVNVPGGYIDRARRVSEFLNERQYRQPNEAGDPNNVYGKYVRGGT